MQEKINIGILGCGPIAQFAHLEACRKAANVQLYAVCDVDAVLREKMGSYYEATRIYGDYHDMLADEQIDAVIIATADAFHLPAAIQAVSAGKHVLVEKPLGNDLQQAMKLRDLTIAHNRYVQIGHMKRYDPGIKYAYHFVQTELGTPVKYKGWYCDSSRRYDMTDSTQPLPFVGKNAKKPERDPKKDLSTYYLMAHGSHLLDLARLLAGPLLSIKASFREVSGIHSWLMDVDFDSGLHGQLDLTVAIHRDWHEGFEIYGTQGSAVGKIYNPWYFKTSRVQCFTDRTGLYTEPLDHRAHFWQRQLEGFADTILYDRQSGGATIDDGIASIQAMLAIKQSITLSKKVKLTDIQYHTL